MDPTLVLFAIQAGIQLGRKVYDIYVEKNFNRPLLLPFGDLAPQPLETQALLFFAQDQNRHWIEEQPLQGILVKNGALAAYKALLGLTEADSSWNEISTFISGSK